MAAVPNVAKSVVPSDVAVPSDAVPSDPVPSDVAPKFGLRAYLFP